MLPTLCRMVLFRDPEGRGPMPAVVNQVDETGVYVCAFDSVFGPRNFHTKGEGAGPGEWSWPERTEDQAANAKPAKAARAAKPEKPAVDRGE